MQKLSTDLPWDDKKIYTRDELHKRLIEVAAQSPAKKRKVGAVIVRHDGGYMKDNVPGQYIIMAEGYNFNLSGGPCETEDGVTHENVIHAEVACLNNLKDFDVGDLNNMVMFVTHEPCDGCKAAILSKSITYEVIGDFLKFDGDKPRLALVPPSLILGVAKVLTYGAKKYKANNWRKTPDVERYISAAERHLMAWKAGEELDPESGLHHLEHLACNVAFLIELKELPKIQVEQQKGN